MAVVLARDQAEPNTFEDLFGGFSARYCYIDGKYYISVRDLIIGMCVENPKESKDVWEKACCYASKTWNRIIECKRIRNIDDFLKTFQFEGPREKHQDVLEMKGVLKLIMVLPGNCAMDKRCQAVDIMQRYFGGDLSLVGEIEANARSDHPIAQMFRASMGSAAVGVENDEERGRKRQRLIEDLEVDNLRLHNEGLAIMNRQRLAEADKAAAEADKAAAEADKAAAEADKAAAEAQRVVEETERIKHENEAAELKKQQDENTRAIKQTKKFRCDFGEICKKFMCGVLNSKTFMANNLRYNSLRLRTQMMGDGGDILNVEQAALFKYFLEFLDVNDYKETKTKPKNDDFRRMVLGLGAVCEGKVFGYKCYAIDYDKLRAFFAGGKNGYDAEIVF